MGRFWQYQHHNRGVAKTAGTIFEIIEGVGTPLWDTLQGSTLSQGCSAGAASFQGSTGEARFHRAATAHIGRPLFGRKWYTWHNWAQFGSIFLAGKMCDSNKMVTLLTFKRHAKTSKLPSHIAFKIVGQIKGGLAKPQSSQH